MADTAAQIDIIRTKLHRPPVTRDLVPRTQLLERLEYRRQRPLTLVSAPAGYGKSTLVSHWLEVCEYPGVWISLDEYDNDLHQFLTYVVEAIRTLFPDAVQQTATLLNAPELPPVPVISRTLLNELEQVEQLFLLVLDDYHCVRDDAIHDLVKELLRYPSPILHLVIVTRHNPPLPLSTLRGRGQMTEIRARDLRFSVAETMTFLQQALEVTVDEEIAAILEQRAEGWVTGLRFAALSVRHQDDFERLLSGLPQDDHYVMEYLVAEVLSQQPPAIQHYLISTASLDRFCAPLCETMCQSLGGDTTDLDGAGFLAWLERANLFLVPLDGQQEWFRYHHLFQEFLEQQLLRRISPERHTALHATAGTWFAEHGFMDEALQHVLHIDAYDTARHLIVDHRRELFAQQQWHRLRRWLDLLPNQTVEHDPELLSLQIWSYNNQNRYGEIFQLLDRIEPLLDEVSSEQGVHERLRAEVNIFRSLRHYFDGKGHSALRYAQQAVDSLPPACPVERGYALLMLGFSLQMTGDLRQAYQIIYRALDQDSLDNKTYHGVLLATLCFLQWMAADLGGLRHTSATLLKIGTDHHLPDTIALARYFKGVVSYEANDLAVAEETLKPVVSGNPLQLLRNYVFSVIALSLVYEAQGRSHDARHLLGSVMTDLLEIGHTVYVPILRAFEAELALRQGRLAEAIQWVEIFEPKAIPVGHNGYVPELTAVKVWLAQGTAASLAQAGGLLDNMRQFFTEIHNTRFLSEVLAVQSVLYDRQEDDAAALQSLSESLRLAESGGFIRLFVDLGPGMAVLLRRVLSQNGPVSYIGKILTAFRNEGPNAEQETANAQEERQADAAKDRSLTEVLTAQALQPWSELFTKREREILSLLAQRLTSQEIADKLFVSPNTVKRHSINIYKKLGVHSRQEALAKVDTLGMFSER